MELKSGTLLQLGKYRISRPLGKGGFGVTYLAVQDLIDRDVCIKEFFPKQFYNRDNDSHNISLGSQGSAEMMDRFKAKFIKEAHTIGQLDHPNIIHIYDVFQENNTAYYVMEYVDGVSLQSLVERNGAMSEDMAKEYIYQTSQALGYIHERNILHLDIKPGNIMVRNRDNRAIVIDFGLSKQYDNAGNQTSSTPLGISHGYAPIEQYNAGELSEFSRSSDIYSLGATLYYLVTAKMPPIASTIAEYGVPQLPEHLSPSVTNAIKAAMAFRRSERPQTIEEFQKILYGEATQISQDFAKTNIPSAPQQTPQMPQSSNSNSINIGNKSLPEANDDPLAELNVDMVYVEGGEFIMDHQKGGLFSKSKVYKVGLSPYFISKYPITQRMWRLVMKNTIEDMWRASGKSGTPLFGVGDNLPMYCINHQDAMMFCKQLSAYTGIYYRIPTEAEWEYAARGGKFSKGCIYSGSNNLDEVGWHSENSGGLVHPVGQKAPNELGIYDMSGNVWEWCMDRYGKYPTGEIFNPSGPQMGAEFVLRGGNITSDADKCAVSHRNSCPPLVRALFTPGFRIVCLPKR